MDASPKAVVKAAALCTSCPKMCRFSCPVAVADGRESSTPTAKMTTASLLARGKLAATPEACEPLYRCTGCGIQQKFCKHDIDAADTLEAARAAAYEAGALPHRLREQEHRFRTDRAPLAHELAAAAAAIPAPAGRPVALLLAGCRMLRDDAGAIPRQQRLLTRALQGPVAPWSRDPMCCGYPLLALGDRRALEGQAKAFAKAARDAGTLVASDPSCGFMLRRVYGELGVRLKPEVLTLPEALARGASRLAASAPVRERLVYHDGCHLGRRLSVYDAPRELLCGAGAELVAPPWDREEARCCGFGGGYPILDPAAARRIADLRHAELVSTGAARIVTGCPSCKLALARNCGPPVEDVAEVVARSVGA